MKAIIKSTGEIIEVEKLKDTDRYCCDAKKGCYHEYELYFIDDDINVKYFRILAAKDILCSIISKNQNNMTDADYDNAISNSVRIANNLIYRLELGKQSNK